MLSPVVSRPTHHIQRLKDLPPQLTLCQRSPPAPRQFPAQTAAGVVPLAHSSTSAVSCSFSSAAARWSTSMPLSSSSSSPLSLPELLSCAVLLVLLRGLDLVVAGVVVVTLTRRFRYHRSGPSSLAWLLQIPAGSVASVSTTSVSCISPVGGLHVSLASSGHLLLFTDCCGFSPAADYLLYSILVPPLELTLHLPSADREHLCSAPALLLPCESLVVDRWSPLTIAQHSFMKPSVRISVCCCC